MNFLKPVSYSLSKIETQKSPNPQQNLRQLVMSLMSWYLRLNRSPASNRLSFSPCKWLTKQRARVAFHQYHVTNTGISIG